MKQPQSHQISQKIFSLSEVCYNVCVPPLSVTLEELKTNITEASVKAGHDIIHDACLETEYQLSIDEGARVNPTGLLVCIS